MTLSIDVVDDAQRGHAALDRGGPNSRSAGGSLDSVE
jgi:hypothetical protein